MTNVERYSINTGYDGCPDMRFDEKGGWVDFDDYEVLSNKNEELMTALIKLAGFIRTPISRRQLGIVAGADLPEWFTCLRAAIKVACLREAIEKGQPDGQ